MSSAAALPLAVCTHSCARLRVQFPLTNSPEAVLLSHGLIHYCISHAIIMRHPSPTALSDSAAAAIVAARASSPHAPRFAALLLVNGRASRVPFLDASGALIVRSVGGQAAATLSFLFEETTTPPSIDLSRAGAWNTDWTLTSPPVGVMVAATPERSKSAVEAALRRVGRAVTWSDSFQTFKLPGAAYEAMTAGFSDPTIPLDVGAVNAHLKIPEGFTLDVLRPEEAPILNKYWKYAAGAATESGIRHGITCLPSACLRVAAINEANGNAAAAPGGSVVVGAPVCWVVTRYDGSLGVLHTLDDYRGRGFARAVMIFAIIQTRRWANGLLSFPPREQAGLGGADGLTPSDVASLAPLLAPYSHVAEDNVPSTRVLRSLGMVPDATRVTWVESEALLPRFNLRPLRTDDPGEWTALVALVNASYKQDDAFFVDQWRTAQDGSELRAMGQSGIFFVGYRLSDAAVMAAAAAGAGDVFTLGLEHPVADVMSHAAATGGKPASETDELLVCMYLRAPDMPFYSVCALPRDVHAPPPKQPSLGLPQPSNAPTHGAQGGATAAAAAAVQLSMLTVHPSLKKLGVAQRLLDVALAVAREALRCTALECHVVSVKPWLLRFYERNGFSVVGADPWPEELNYQLILPTFFHRCVRQLMMAGASGALGAAEMSRVSDCTDR